MSLNKLREKFRLFAESIKRDKKVTLNVWDIPMKHDKILYLAQEIDQLYVSLDLLKNLNGDMIKQLETLSDSPTPPKDPQYIKYYIIYTPICKRWVSGIEPAGNTIKTTSDITKALRFRTERVAYAYANVCYIITNNDYIVEPHEVPREITHWRAD